MLKPHHHTSGAKRAICLRLAQKRFAPANSSLNVSCEPIFSPLDKTSVDVKRTFLFWQVKGNCHNVLLMDQCCTDVSTTSFEARSEVRMTIIWRHNVAGYIHCKIRTSL